MRQRNRSAGDLDMQTFMSLMVVLIPVLLAAAEFAKITIIDVSLSEGGANTDMPGLVRPVEDEKLKATVLVSDSSLTVGARGGFLESIRYTVPNSEESWETAVHVDEKGRSIKGYFTTEGELLTDSVGNICTDLSAKSPVYIGGSDKEVAALSPDSLTLASVPAVVSLQAQLTAVHRRFALFPDIKDMTIGSDSSIVYDCLVQIMDASRSGGFENISFAKIRN